MRATPLISPFLFLLAASPLFAQNAPASLQVGGFVGFRSGVSGQAFVLARDFAEGLPVQVRLGLGRSLVEPGSATAARKIFINNATNGTPVEKGSTSDLALDAVLPAGPRSYFFAGVRYTRFKANFKYVGGNEDFDVTSSHWGVGTGMETRYSMGSRVDLVAAGGAEYFFGARLTGHDTSYSSDGDDVNPREDYTYDDADDAIGQPTWRPMLAVGFSYQLGGG